MLKTLIFIGVSKWCTASKIIDSSESNIWKMNPQGFIVRQNHINNKMFWNLSSLSADLICAVDGAWSGSTQGLVWGGIGGIVKDKN